MDRRSQYILLGFLRDARTMPSPAACLDTCITASTNLGFQCYSVMYYYEVRRCYIFDMEYQDFYRKESDKFAQNMILILDSNSRAIKIRPPFSYEKIQSINSLKMSLRIHFCFILGRKAKLYSERRLRSDTACSSEEGGRNSG